MRVTLDPTLQSVLAFLSVPLVSAFLIWLAPRFTRVGRLTLRLEKLAGIHAGMPEGAIRREFAERVNEVGAELNKRLDPLFKQERRRKRIAGTVVFGVVGVMALLFSGTEWTRQGGPEWTGIVLGIVLVGVFWLIERDTRRQRTVIAATREAA